MRSLNIKKAAAVAAGTALLLGAALAAVPDAAKDKAFYWDASGNTNVQIVVTGGDAVPAGNLAAVIGHKAYSSGGSTTADALGTVGFDVTGGSASAVPKTGAFVDVAFDIDITDVQIGEDMVLSEAHGMNSGEFTFAGSDYDYKESITVDTTTELTYSDGKDYHGISFEATSGGNIAYKFDFINNFPAEDTKLNQSVEIDFLGETYAINKAAPSKINLIKGAKVDLGIGQSMDVDVEDLTYTVTLDSSRIDEINQVGYAGVTITGGGLTQPLPIQLDTASNQDVTTADGVYVYLQSVQKSYTPGQGGAATLRVGGALLELQDGDYFPGTDEKWDVTIEPDTVGTKIDWITISYNDNHDGKDQVTQIDGPNDYFTLKYSGSKASRGEFEIDRFTVGATDEDDFYVVNTVSYSDTDENQYSLDLWDSSEHRAKTFLGNGTGAVGNATGANASLLYPLRTGDYVIIKEQPVKITGVSFDNVTLSKSYVNLKAGDTTTQYKLSDVTDYTTALTDTVYGGAAAGADDIITDTVSVSVNQGSQDVTFWMINRQEMDDTFTTKPGLYISSGIDDDSVVSDYYQFMWTPATWNTTAVAYTEANMTVTLDLDNWGTDIVYDYDKSGDEKGIQDDQDFINQRTDDRGEDDNTYHMMQYANFEATGSDTIVADIFKEGDEGRVQLIPGEDMTDDAVGSSAYTVTSDMTFPYSVTSDITVNGFTCEADAVETGVSFGNVAPNLVVSDSVTPAGNAIVIGGHYVNMRAVGMTEAQLTKAGDKMLDMSGNTLYAAGYTAADTAAVIDELIAAIMAL